MTDCRLAWLSPNKNKDGFPPMLSQVKERMSFPWRSRPSCIKCREQVFFFSKTTTTKGMGLKGRSGGGVAFSGRLFGLSPALRIPGAVEGSNNSKDRHIKITQVLISLLHQLLPLFSAGASRLVYFVRGG